jgi:hypothetical protein
MVIWDFGMCKGRERKGMAAWEQVVRVVVGIGVVEEVVGGVGAGGRRGQSSFHFIDRCNL